MIRWMMLFALVVVVLVGFGQGAWAQASDSITVTVSLGEEFMVVVDPNNLDLGQLSLGGVSGPHAATATVGNTTTQLDIRATDGAGGWVIGNAAGSDQFRVAVSSPALNLTTTDQQLDAGVVPYASRNFNLTYHAPTADTFGAGVGQGFSITITASSP
jgi:hypothetical protein